MEWLRSILDWQKDLSNAKDFMESLKIDLFTDEVFVFTPKGSGARAAGGFDAGGLRL